ncbi:hypothetical protein NHQ30_011025 [Ciborinia camelliae]|nr:hypothetical protein NHQ30_011025 [Ciborinia camelliae]
MALNPDEQESQVVAPLHSPPPEQEYLDDAFPGGAYGYRNTDDGQGFDADDEQMDDFDTGKGVTDEMVMDTQLIPQQKPSHNFQQDSNKSFSEETQLEGIDRDPQPIRNQQQSFQKDTQNASFSSRSFVEETQLVAIEIDTQASEDATQFASSNPSSQRQAIHGDVQTASNFVSHTSMSPAKFISKPPLPEAPGFKYGVAAHTKKNHESTVQNTPAPKAAAQPERHITKPLPKSTPIPGPREEPPAKPVQPTRRAPHWDHNTSVPPVPNVSAGLSVKPSVLQKEVVPTVQNTTVVGRLSGPRSLPSMDLVQPPRRMPPTVHKTSVHHQVPDVRSSSSLKAPGPEKETHPHIRNNLAAEHLSDVRILPSMNPVNCSRTGPSSVRHELPDANIDSSLKALAPRKEARSIVQDTSTANTLIRMQDKRVADPLLQTEDTQKTSRGIFSQSASDIGPSKDANFSKEPNKFSMPKASHNEQLKQVELPQQDTSTPTHGPQRLKLRQRSSNQLNRFSVKTKFNVNLVKKAPFPEAFSDHPKVRVHRDKPRKIQVPSAQLEKQPEYSESQLVEDELPTRIHAAAESSESRRSPIYNNPTQCNQVQRNNAHLVINPAVGPDSRIDNSNDRTEDSAMTPVEYEECPPAEDSRQSHQSIPVSQFRSDYHMAQSVQHPSMYREHSNPVSQANTSRPQSRVGSSRPQPMARTQAGNQTQRKAMNRPMPPHDLEPQGISEVVPSHSGRTKVAKASAAHSRDDSSQISQVGDHVSSGQERPHVDVYAVYKVIEDVQKQQSIIKTQENEISNLKAKLQDAETKFQGKCAINAELNANKDELLKRVEKLSDMSNKYRQHINDVVICQKALREDSKEMKSTMRDLQAVPTPESKEIEDRIRQGNRMKKLLEQIKQAQREQIQRDSRNAHFETLYDEIDQLERANERLKADLESKLVELQQERYRIEQLQKQISSGEVDRHKEVMEILQKPQVDTLGELTKEDGILNKVLTSSEGVQGKLDEMSKTVANTLSQTSEWPQTLTKILEEFYSRIQTKLDDNGSKDTTFQESTVKLFDDLKERLNQVNGELDEKTKLNEQLNLLRENNATLKANLNSKEAESENNVARLNELTRELSDIRSQLMNKTEQLALSTAQPREDPEMKRKIDDLTMDTLRLQSLLTAANNDKLLAENSVQTHQATITTVQNHLRETEDKLKNVELAMETLEGSNRKFQNECRSATERVRQETTQLALSRRKDLVAQHDTIVNDLNHKQAETEKKLQIAVEKSKTSKETTDKHSKTISKLQSEIATYKDQLLQQKLQLQSLEESSISATQLLKQKEEHDQEILSIRQEQANQQASSQACREQSLKIKGELEGAQKRLRGMNEENENLKKENDRLRQRLESINAITEDSQNVIGGPSRVGDTRPPARRPAERRSSNSHSQRHDEVIGVNQRKAPEFIDNAVITSSLSRTYGDNNGGSQTPIKPFHTIASLETSPLTDLEDIMPKVQSAHSREELERVYNKNRQVSNDKIAHIDTVVRSKYYPHGEGNLGTPNSKRSAVVIAVEGVLINTPNQMPRAIPSIVQESIQRRMSKPLKSAMKKGDHQDTPITLGSSQDQVYNQKDNDESVNAIFKKPALRNNRGLNNGLQAIPRTGASSYNRIASGKPNIPSSRAPEQQTKAAAPLYEPTPEIKRNAMKRARSNSTFVAQDLQPNKPAKAPRISHRQPINKTVIPDSQDRS